MFSKNLLAWYDKDHRHLPWRQDKPNPYHTWLSEIMLQQTTVATVIPYFEGFIKKWPTLADLASSNLDDILTEWQGLGYYSRARNLHRCAQILAHDFPSTEADLLKLPGIGPYTAAAIASIAFNQKAAAVDGNVVRVMSRYLSIKDPNPKDQIKESLKALIPENRCGDFTQALMELGALICRPKNPSCILCPLQEACKAKNLGKIEEFPYKKPKKDLPTRYTTAFIIRRKDGAILLRKRPLKGLLGGMMEVPTTPWEHQKQKENSEGPLVKHTFTHFHLEVEVCKLLDTADYSGIWVKPADFKKHALPTVMKKILHAGLKLF